MARRLGVALVLLALVCSGSLAGAQQWDWITYSADSRKVDGPGGDRSSDSDVYLQQLPASFDPEPTPSGP